MTEAMQDLQNKAINELFEKMSENKKELAFKAPTGSGKTYMMSALMDKILSENENAVFLVSTLSKGGLAEQNFKAFEKFGREKFSNLKPFLIESKNDKSEGLVEIPRDFNVYVLARDLFKEKSVLKAQGVLVNFLNDITGNVCGENKILKKVYLIKDECHQATNNLDELDKERGFFSKVLNISATPKKEQIPSVKIEEAEAVSVNLIKDVEWHEYEDKDIEDILAEFERVKKKYIDNEIGVRPCLIIQISNQNKAESEIEKLKEAILQRAALKYMIILDESNAKKCETNDELGKSNLSIKKWKNYAKENQSSIDIIIFKMVISEGWDIPRACMLYQVRDSKSKQLDEQVIGRVRRNPRLMDYENLSKAQQGIINKARVYGIKPKNEENSTIDVRLKGEIHKGLFANDIINEFKITITRLDRNKVERQDFDAKKVLESCKGRGKDDFFTLFKQLEKAKISHLCKEYVQNDSQKWFDFANNVVVLKKEFEKIATNYDESISTKDENEVELVGNLALESFFIKNNKAVNLSKLNQWIWDLKTQDKYDDSKKFSFDSEAEREFARVISQILEQNVKQINLFDDKKIYLFGKNYPHNSKIKFEYYLDGYHFSYPDFILKDKKERIHIFEIKSLNGMNSSTFTGANLQTLTNDDLANLGEYERKIVELGRIYKAISAKTKNYFWLVIKQTDEKWLLHCFKDGENLYNDELFDEKAFENEVRKRLE